LGATHGLLFFSLKVGIDKILRKVGHTKPKAVGGAKAGPRQRVGQPLDPANLEWSDGAAIIGQGGFADVFKCSYHFGGAVDRNEPVVQ